MEEAEDKVEEFHNRNSRRSEEHLDVSVNNEHSDFDGSKRESQNLKIEPTNSKSTRTTSKPVRIFSGLGGDPRLHRVKALIKNSQKITEQKNEILSRTLAAFKVKSFLKFCFYATTVLLVFSAQCGVDSAPTETSLTNSNKELTSNRTLRYHGAENRMARRPKDHPNPHPHHHHHHHHHRRNNKKKSVNKNCKEYDVTSRAFLADLVFEGTARSRSKRASGRYVTFVIQKVLKQKNNLLRPKMQIRLRFGGKAGGGGGGQRRPSRVNPAAECPLATTGDAAAGHPAKVNVKVGDKYYVFADRFGPMNYTAKGEPIVVNKRNLKSIRSVLSKNKEKPPRVLGLQDVNLKATQQLRLNCQVRGRPVPRINWYKDGAPLIPSSRVNVTYYRRNSTIEIKSLDVKDGGVYECRGTSVTGKTATTSAHVTVRKSYATTTTDPDMSFHIKKCQVDAYCLNGGQCYFIENLGEHMCRCETGFIGARCENKEVSAIGSGRPIEWPAAESP